MTIKELIKELKTHENQEAKVLLTIGNEDNDILSTSDFEVHCLDVLEYVELFINENTCRKQL